jgi:hypothetical protein
LQDLKQLQCDYAQGYLLAKPLKADALGRFLELSANSNGASRPPAARRKQPDGKGKAKRRPVKA